MTAADKANILAALHSTLAPTRRAAIDLARADGWPHRADIHQARALVNTRPIEAAIRAVMLIETSS